MDEDNPNNWVITSKINSSVMMQARKVDTHSVPNVQGMSAKDAIYILENIGLRVKLQGRGAVVSQSLTPGSKVVRNGQIVLDLN
jgi:cell division protein FtsI (penicillin-binding protein 3)